MTLEKMPLGMPPQVIYPSASDTVTGGPHDAGSMLTVAVQIHVDDRSNIKVAALLLLELLTRIVVDHVAKWMRPDVQNGAVGARRDAAPPLRTGAAQLGAPAERLFRRRRLPDRRLPAAGRRHRTAPQPVRMRRRLQVNIRCESIRNWNS